MVMGISPPLAASRNLIIRGGENIAPLEIEERLNSMEAIAQASVVGVPDGKYGEAVGAFLDLKRGKQKPKDEEVRKWVREDQNANVYMVAWGPGSARGVAEDNVWKGL